MLLYFYWKFVILKSGNVSMTFNDLSSLFLNLKYDNIKIVPNILNLYLLVFDLSTISSNVLFRFGHCVYNKKNKFLVLK